MTLAREGFGTWVLWGCLIALLSGCSQPKPPPFPTYFEPEPAYIPVSGSGNAFDVYALAALKAESVGGDYLTRVSFTPGMKASIIEKLAEPMNSIAKTSVPNFEFEFRAIKPLQPPSYQRGWLLIGRAMAWRVETAVRNEEFAEAVNWTLAATRFGFDLTGGGATDASLGLGIVDQARVAILPGLALMPPAELERLSTGLSDALARRPKAEQVVAHEYKNMLAAVQFVQDAFRAKEYDKLRDRFGLDVRDAVEYLQRLSGKSAGERARYFDDFKALADTMRDRYAEMANLSARQRANLPEFDLTKQGASWRFAKQFFTAPDSFFRMRDASIARTRLLAIESRLRALLKTKQPLPPNLDVFGSDVKIDPYTGVPFAYRTEGEEYRLYSVGPNFIDDLGETNLSFNEPDLTLEKR
ncbi:MAG: hypothetical protein KF784_03700 [Fimbriimonadaceae bacterium]|nr:hypothetical protein [Fimbriimonadaceae bacterium]